MDNLFKATSSNELNKLFESSAGKIVVLFFFTKTNPDCRKTVPFFEKCAMRHTISHFCIVDIDRFEGNNRFVNNVNNLPKVDTYYEGDNLGSWQISTEQDIESAVRSSEQHMIIKNNNKNNMANPNSNMNMSNQMSNINPMQIQQQILNNAQMSNPSQFQFLMQNPMVLQQMVQKQMQTVQQQQMMQQMMQSQVPNMMNGMNMNGMMNMPNMSGVPNMSNMLNSNMPNSVSMLNTSTDSAGSVLPTFQQMQQMFQIFQMMQQMGILNTNSSAEIPTELNVGQQQNQQYNQQTQQTQQIPPQEIPNQNEMILPNGDKLVPLPNGKYGLVRKS